MTTKSTTSRVVIVGAGFGGLSAAKALANTSADVMVIDRNNYHGFWPLLYQVATAGLEPDAIAHPTRAIFSQYANVNFRMATVTNIDFDQKLVLTDNAPVPYDYLILAAGSTTHFFGNDKLAAITYTLKDLSDAELLRQRVLCCFEQASHTPDPQQRRELMTFVLVGGGPTGVELAGALSELFRHVLRNDYPELDVNDARVILIEGLDSLLPVFPQNLGRDAQQRLEHMGVEVRLNVLVTDANERCVTLQDESTIAARTIVWTAGVRGAPLADALDVDKTKGSRVTVTSRLHLPERPAVFVIGDMANLGGYKGDTAHPMLAPVAIQQGEQAAANILAHMQGQPMSSFYYRDLGMMATIGRRAAVLTIAGVQMTGFLAWLGWLIIHLLQLVGFRNKLMVLTNWLYNYLTYDRAARIIVSRE
jgi:NADH dehydrogenase